MEFRQGITISDWSVIGLGTWAMGGKGWRYSWGHQDDAVSAATVVAAFDSGINWIDTAPVYGVGHAETLIGAILARNRLRHQVGIATKCGFLWEKGSNRPYPRLTRESVFQEIESSLRRLKTDYIDLYQIHWPGPNSDIEAAWESIGKLIEQGKVLTGGVCNLTTSDLSKLNGMRPIFSLQTPYNLLQRDCEKDLLSLCNISGTAVISYSPLASGILTDSFDEKRLSRLPGDDWRSTSSYFQGPSLTANLKAAAALRSYATEHGGQAEQYALAWVLAHPMVAKVIIGARTPNQVSRIVSNKTPSLTAEARRQLGQLIFNACL